MFRPKSQFDALEHLDTSQLSRLRRFIIRTNLLDVAGVILCAPAVAGAAVVAIWWNFHDALDMIGASARTALVVVGCALAVVAAVTLGVLQVQAIVNRVLKKSVWVLAIGRGVR
jgi:hypothetical protein